MKLAVVEHYVNPYSLGHKLKRGAWNICYFILFRPFRGKLFKKWRLLLLRIFGAKIGDTSYVFATARIWAPWHLTVGENSCIGRGAYCFNPGNITVGNFTSISENAFLCAGTHDFEDPAFPPVWTPITIGDNVWVAVDSFIGPNVTIGNGAVIGARAAVFKDVEPWTVVGGNPARFIKKRTIKTKE